MKRIYRVYTSFDETLHLFTAELLFVFFLTRIDKKVTRTAPEGCTAVHRPGKRDLTCRCMKRSEQNSGRRYLVCTLRNREARERRTHSRHAFDAGGGKRNPIPEPPSLNTYVQIRDEYTWRKNLRNKTATATSKRLYKK